MKRILSLALIASLGVADTLAVCKNLSGGRNNKSCWCDRNADAAYDNLAEALNNATDNDEIEICSNRNGSTASYKESDLNITAANLYIHSYDNDPTLVVIHDNSGKPIFNIKNSGIRLENLTINQNSAQVDINVSAYINDDSVNGIVKDLTFKDLILHSSGKGILLKFNINNTFDDVNITSKDISFESDWSEFYGVKILNSEFNQTSDDIHVFVSYATNFRDNNFTNSNFYSDSGYGAKFNAMKDTNFSNFHIESDENSFEVAYSNLVNVDNIRFIDSNLSSKSGRGISIDGNLSNSYFEDFNISSYYESIYAKEDINHSTFKNFILKGNYGFYADEYIRKSLIEDGEINGSYGGIYSDKELNETTLNNLYIEAEAYGLWFSENSSSGSKNEDNNLTNLRIIQKSNNSDYYSGIKFRKSVYNNLFEDINISATKRAIWLSTGGKYNTFKDLELNSSEGQSFVNSGLIYDNTFENIKTNSYKVSFSFRADVKNNEFNNLDLTSKTLSGMYNSDENDEISSNNFTNIKIHSETFGIYFKGDSKDNNFTNLYIRVNEKKGVKFERYSINNYFLDIDTNGTKGIELNISQDDVIQKANIVTNEYEPIYIYTLSSPLKLYDLNLTSKKDNCIYIDEMDADVNISTVSFSMNEFNCSNYNGIQVSQSSDYSLGIKNSKFYINDDSADTSKALIKVNSLDTLFLSNSLLDAGDLRKGIYVTSGVNNFYMYKTIIKDANDNGIELAKVNNKFDIKDGNISNSEKYGVYIKSVGSNFNFGEIKRNYFNDNKDYAIKLFDNEEDTDKIEVWTNCFYYNQDNDGYSQAYTYDPNAKYDDGKAGNFWSDSNVNSEKYQIDPSDIGLYDNHTLAECPLKVKFDARDDYRDYGDNNISIKIAGKKFNLTIFTSDNSLFSGTVCSEIIEDGNRSNVYAGWHKMVFDDESEKNWTDIEVNNSVRNARVYTIWSSDSDISCEELANENDDNENDSNRSNSTDTFAIRPYKFRVIFSKMPLYAGEEFDLNVSAIGFNGKTLSEYNRTDRNISVEMNESSLVCDYPDAEFNLSSLDFNDGDSNNSAKFDEVGEMNLTIVDNDFDLANGGEDECNDSSECVNVYGYDGEDSKGVFCCNIEANPKWDVNLSEVDIRVYDLNITNHYIKTTYGKDWIYMDSNLSEFNASPTIEITAFNKSGKQLHNFDKLCLAKDMNISFGYNVHNDNGDINLTYVGTINDDNKSIEDFNKSIEVNMSLFVKGDANSSYAFNVERNSSKALYIVYANLKEINFTTDGIAKNENNLSTDLNISMYYGNVKTFDVTTNKDSIDVKVYFVVYDNDSEYKPSNENKAFNWYLNPKHTNSEGKFSSTIHISDDYTAKDKYNDDFDISVDDVNEGEQVIHITRKNDNIHFAVFHLTMDTNASHWLWFSYDEKDYNDSLDSTCASHFCFAITWSEANNDDNSKTVKSGDNLLGTEAPVSEYNRTSKGVKIYR